MAPPRVDLHLHTLLSDGTFTPEEVVQRARSAGLAAISITDHDSVAALSPARRTAGPSLEIISGVELTAAFKERELHILGYGFLETDPALQRYLEQAQGGRRARIQAMIDRLKEQGIQVTLEEVETQAGDVDSIGRPHLAEAMKKKGIVGSLSEAFDRYIGDHAPCFVHKATLSVEQAVQLIRQAGGVTVLAHPHRMVEEDWLPELIRQGIQGIEVYHPDHSSSVAEKYRRFAEGQGLLITGGSDCHGLRRPGGPFIGKVPVPYRCLEQIKNVIASEAKQSHL
ncbi:MAG: PHP domain-containing protein [Candidatus Omnitrophica bacterium]|nr:PHP domain-containing protein [Candidatus Omnitrophota bacterium]